MPTTTTGVATSFIDFTRASNATVTDSDGKVKWAPHNLLTNSESFDAAAWAKTTLTFAANADVAPNSTTTADTLTAGGANSTILQTFTAEDVAYTYGVWLRRKTGTGTIQIAADSGTWNTVTITSSWALYTISQTPTAGSKTAGIRIVTSGDEVYAWGAHLYRSDLGGMQPNTSAYPMYNPTTPKNLLGYTEDFGNAYWGKSNLAATPVIANAILAPNGLQTADKIVEGNTTNIHNVSKTGIAVNIGSQNTLSISVKGSGRTQCMIQYFDGTTNKTPIFSLADGTKVVDGGIGSSWSAVSQGDGWWRFSITVTTATASAGIYVYPCVAGSASYTGDGTSGIYLWGAQLSDSASLDSYSPVYGAAVTSAAYYGPRRDFDSAGVCRGLLVEEQRTNAVTYSSDFSNWSGSTATVNTNVVTAPDGTLTADEVVRATAASDHRFLAVTLTGDGSKAVSIFVKYNTAPTFSILLFDLTAVASRAEAVFTFTAGVPSATSTPAGSVEAIEPWGNGWYRIKMVATGVIAANTNRVYVYPAATGSSNGQKTTFWGAQAEVQTASFSTSLIPTIGATATRNADVASVSTQAFPYSASAGTLVVNASSPCIAAIANMITLDNGTTQERIRLLTDVASVKTIVTESNTTQANLSPGSATANIPFKFAVAYKVNDFAAVVNGSAAATDAAGNVPVVNIARLGADSSGNYLNGHIRQITYIPRRISNTELQTRTA